MLRILKVFIFVSFWASPFYQIAYGQDVLHIASGGGPLTRNIFQPIYTQFEQETGIKIAHVWLHDFKSLDDDDNWIMLNGESIDLVNGQISHRMKTYFQQGKIKSINSFWDEHNLDDSFLKFKAKLTHNNQILGLPYSVITWQIFYLKSSFPANFNPPKTLQELEQVCRNLGKQGVIAFHHATKTAWVEMAWFEYLVLRTQGLDFLNKLANGQISFMSDEVLTVLKAWQKLKLSACFSRQYGEMTWTERNTFFFRKKIKFMLMGASLYSRLKDPIVKQDLAAFPFPKISSIAQYESTPINAFHAVRASKKQKLIEKFLLFVSRAEIQEKITEPLASIAANSNARMPQSLYNLNLDEYYLNTKDSSIFIDRILIPEFEIESRTLFSRFAVDNNLEYFRQNLEKLRIKYYQNPIVK